MLAQKHAVTYSAETAAASRKARRLYLGNLPDGMGLTTTQIVDFFNMAAQASGICIMAGGCVVDAWISPEGKYGFVEFRSIDECTAAIALNGISLQGRQLVIKRPNDYEQAPDHIPTGVALTGGQPNVGASIGAMPLPNPAGMAAILSGIPGMPPAVNPLAGLSHLSGKPMKPEHPPSTVLVMSNMVTMSDLQNDDDYEDVTLDTKEECEKYGTVVKVHIPRPTGSQVNGLGKVIVMFSKAESALKARDALHGRLFDNRAVEVTFMDESKFLVGDFSSEEAASTC